MNARDKRVVELLARETLPLLEDTLGRRDLCVLATQTGLAVLRHFGIEAKPQPCVAAAMNEQVVEWIESGRELPKKHDSPEAKEFEDSGAWIVQIDEVDSGEKGRYPGHLAIYLPKTNSLLDLSVGQFARPEKGILLPDGGLFDELPEGFSEGARAAYPLAGGGAILYEGRDDKGRFRQGGDWKRKTEYPGKLIRSIRAQLEEVPA